MPRSSGLSSAACRSLAFLVPYAHRRCDRHRYAEGLLEPATSQPCSQFRKRSPVTSCTRGTRTPTSAHVVRAHEQIVALLGECRICQLNLAGSIHFASMANPNDEDQQRGVFDGVEDAVVADTDSEN